MCEERIPNAADRAELPNDDPVRAVQVVACRNCRVSSKGEFGPPRRLVAVARSVPIGSANRVEVSDGAVWFHLQEV